MFNNGQQILPRGAELHFPSADSALKILASVWLCFNQWFLTVKPFPKLESVRIHISSTITGLAPQSLHPKYHSVVYGACQQYL